MKAGQSRIPCIRTSMGASSSQGAMDPSSFLRCAGGSRDATRGTLASLFFLVLGLSLFEEFVLGLAKPSRGVVEARDVGRSGQGGSIGQGGSVQGPGAVRMDASLH